MVCACVGIVFVAEGKQVRRQHDVEVMLNNYADDRAAHSRDESASGVAALTHRVGTSVDAEDAISDGKFVKL